MPNRIQIRRDRSANWSTLNPILFEGEIGFDLDARKWKVGDGTSNWQSLPYMNDPPVTSVSGKQGDIALSADDISGLPAATILGRDLSGNGPCQHLGIGTGLSISSGVLTASPFVGDGQGQVSAGAVPAPAPGDAAAGKVLGAGGRWVTQTSVSILQDNQVANGNDTVTGSVSGRSLKVAIDTNIPKLNNDQLADGNDTIAGSVSGASLVKVLNGRGPTVLGTRKSSPEVDYHVRSDGSTDATSLIRQAVNALPQAGGIIRFEGDFYIASTGTPNVDMTLAGTDAQGPWYAGIQLPDVERLTLCSYRESHRAKIWDKAPATTRVCLIWGDRQSSILSPKLTIENLELDGGMVPVPVDVWPPRPGLDDYAPEITSRRLVRVDNYDDVLVQGVWGSRSRQMGITASEARRIRYFHNHMYLCTRDALRGDAYTVEIAHNEVLFALDDGIACHSDQRKAGTLTNPFTTVGTSRLVKVAHTNHLLKPGNYVSFSGGSAFNGIEMTGVYRVVAVETDGNSYYVFAGSLPSTAVSVGSGGSVSYHYGEYPENIPHDCYIHHNFLYQTLAGKALGPWNTRIVENTFRATRGYGPCAGEAAFEFGEGLVPADSIIIEGNIVDLCGITEKYQSGGSIRQPISLMSDDMPQRKVRIRNNIVNNVPRLPIAFDGMRFSDLKLGPAPQNGEVPNHYLIDKTLYNGGDYVRWRNPSITPTKGDPFYTRGIVLSCSNGYEQDVLEVSGNQVVGGQFARRDTYSFFYSSAMQQRVARQVTLPAGAAASYVGDSITGAIGPSDFLVTHAVPPRGYFEFASNPRTDRANGSILFDGCPQPNATIKLNGVTWTFKTSGAVLANNESNIVANDLTATLTRLVADLNASANALLSVATYSLVGPDTLFVYYDTDGSGGQSYTLAVTGSPTPNFASRSGATLSNRGSQANNWISIDGQRMTFVAVVTDATIQSLLVPGNLSATLDNLVAALNTSTNTTLSRFVYWRDGNRVCFESKIGGLIDNAVILAVNLNGNSNATPSGTTMSGGTTQVKDLTLDLTKYDYWRIVVSNGADSNANGDAERDFWLAYSIDGGVTFISAKPGSTNFPNEAPGNIYESAAKTYNYEDSAKGPGTNVFGFGESTRIPAQAKTTSTIVRVCAQSGKPTASVSMSLRNIQVELSKAGSANGMIV